jgi:putative ABC transport system permease protein
MKTQKQLYLDRLIKSWPRNVSEDDEVINILANVFTRANASYFEIEKICGRVSDMMDDSFNNTFEVEQKLGRIFMTFTVLSLLIACLGLFGLAAFNAQMRTKEIGIRKVMGASVSQITYRLTKDFLKLVAVAIVIALPAGWFAMNKWLEDFSFRIDIPLWIYALATFSAILISILTVSYQSIKAALVNPIQSLKTE